MSFLRRSKSVLCGDQLIKVEADHTKKYTAPFIMLHCMRKMQE